jgi:hypoxanthine-guanine phosphoribosyltransferase
VITILRGCTVCKTGLLPRLKAITEVDIIYV